MKRNGRIIGIIIMVINVILIVACCVFYFQADRTAPQLEFQAGEQIYSEGMEQAELLQNIIAHDNSDGDITDRIVIEKVIENKDERNAVVFYAVSDKAGNVTKKSREFPAIYNENETLDEKTESVDAEEGISDEQNGTPESTEVTTPTPEPTATPTTSPVPTISPTPEPTEEPVQPAPQPTRNPAAPILSLKVSEVNTKVGEAPAWVNLIQNLSDDRDSYETLFHNLKISKYDGNTAGSYAVTVSTEDSDGNVSAVVPITIHVK